MKKNISFPPAPQKRDDYLKSPQLTSGKGPTDHAHSHTRGELPGRQARNFKAVAAAQGSSTSQSHS